MNTYQGIITKKEFVKELRAHQKADDFIKGSYWNGSKGCAVGCSLESIKRTKKIELSESDHAQYPTLLGIPEWLARVEDTIFEGLPLGRSKSWPVEFAKAIPENVDLEKLKGPFLILVLERTLTTFDHKKYPYVKSAIDGSIALWKRTDIGSDDFKAAARAEARAAREAYVYFADELLKLLRKCK